MTFMSLKVSSMAVSEDERFVDLLASEIGSKVELSRCLGIGRFGVAETKLLCMLYPRSEESMKKGSVFQ
jgi:hypothetical protein